ncbi:MAG: GxxExxY protein [Desulfobacterales bacterium]|jgi:GxxExxY protein
MKIIYGKQEDRDERTYKIIGAAMEVHKELGSGFLEAVYHEALEKEFQLQGISYQSKPEVQITYKGDTLKKTYQPDFLCYEEIIVEVKAISQLTRNEEAQILNYLKASKLSPGLLINFGARSLQHKRFVYSFLK